MEIVSYGGVKIRSHQQSDSRSCARRIASQDSQHPLQTSTTCRWCGLFSCSGDEPCVNSNVISAKGYLSGGTKDCGGMFIFTPWLNVSFTEPQVSECSRGRRVLEARMGWEWFGKQ